METLGVIAGLLTSGSLLPQLHKMAKTKSTSDISQTMLLVSLLGHILWVVHGAVGDDIPLTTFASVNFVLNSIAMIIKYKYDREDCKARFTTFKHREEPAGPPLDSLGVATNDMVN